MPGNDETTYSRWVGLIKSAPSLLLGVSLASISGFVWIVSITGDLKSEILAVKTSFTKLRDDIESLRTPLSIRVFATEAKDAELSRIVSDLRAHVENIDAAGTLQTRLLKHDVDAMRAEMTNQNARCNDVTLRVDQFQHELIAYEQRIQYIIDSITPGNSNMTPISPQHFRIQKKK